MILLVNIEQSKLMEVHGDGHIFVISLIFHLLYCLHYAFFLGVESNFL